MLKSDVLKILKESEGFVSGQLICDRLDVSRTAVWKIIKKLRDEGYNIEAVQNKGYLLKEQADILNEAELISGLDCEWIGKSIYYYSKTDSTNNCIKRLAEKGEKHGTLAVADLQEAGKGRRGRGWFSPPGTGIWMSLLLRPEFEPECASMLTLVAAMAVASAVRDIVGLEAGIKWPNDIVVNGKKICGILTEMSVEADYINYIVCGIGINVNHTEFPEDISSTATSLAIEKGMTLNRMTIIADVCRNFEKYYAMFLETRDMTSFIEEYNNILVNRNSEVRVLDPKGQWCGMALGINPKGELMVEKEDGSITEVYSGEVSVRGIYGYV